MKKIFFILMAICLTVNAFSQIDISKKENQSGPEFQKLVQQIKNKVRMFQENEASLAGNIYNSDEKQEIYNATLELFIGEGEEYEVETPDGNVTMCEPVKIEIFPSKYSKRKKRYRVDEYLTARRRNSENPNFRYKKVDILVSEAVTLDNFESMGNGKFVATAHYMKAERNYKTGEMNTISYQDNTSRTVKIYIETIEKYDKDGNLLKSWIVKLGNINCDNVW